MRPDASAAFLQQVGIHRVRVRKGAITEADDIAMAIMRIGREPVHSALPSSSCAIRRIKFTHPGDIAGQKLRQLIRPFERKIPGQRKLDEVDRGPYNAHAYGKLGFQRRKGPAEIIPSRLRPCPSRLHVDRQKRACRRDVVTEQGVPRDIAPEHDCVGT